MKSFEASATINASPEAGWAVLIDGGAYPSWDSGVIRVEGRIAPGRRSRSCPRLIPIAPSREGHRVRARPADGVERGHAARAVQRGPDVHADAAGRDDPVVAGSGARFADGV
jgi:hypothetical protein